MLNRCFILGALLAGFQFVMSGPVSVSMYPVAIRIEYPEGYTLSQQESDSLLKILFADYPTLRHTSEKTRLVLRFNPLEFQGVSKMAPELVRLELTGQLVLEINGVMKKSIPFDSKGMEEGKRKTFRMALEALRWDEEMMEKFLSTFKQTGGVVGPEKEAL